jgi:Cu(I)/Ag(I) efflux system membrane fusion protein
VEAPARQPLYYRNPMGLPDTSPVPKKDPMGMDYVPVYAEEAPVTAEGQAVVRVSPDRVQKLGVRTERAQARVLHRLVRAVGTVQPDERREYAVAPRFEGWIERLYVNATGATVKVGQALMEVYSPELLSAQQEYLIARSGQQALASSSDDIRAGIATLARNALERLRNWEIPPDQIARLTRTGTPSRLLTLRAPATGVVMEKVAVQGMRFMPGEVLYRIADLTQVWLLAEVFEQDLGLMHAGEPARLTVAAYPGRSFTGTVAFVYPTVSPATRTARVRIELPNRDALLKPGMYASLELASGHGEAPVLAVPDAAVLDTGTRQVVLVTRGEGLFEPRRVRLGARAEGYVQVLEGLAAGEEVVVSANFLIDAESNLRAALAGLGSSAGPDAPAVPAPAAPAPAGGSPGGP